MATQHCTRTVALVIGFLVLTLPVSLGAQNEAAFERTWRAGAPASVTGVLTALYQDDFDTGRADLLHFVRDERSGRVVRVHFQGVAPRHLRTGARVTLAGRSSENALYVLAMGDDATATGTDTGTLPTAPVVTGDQRTLVLIANFQDANVSCSVSDIDRVMFSDANGMSVDGLYRDNSRGLVTFSGAIAGPYTIDASSTTGCDLTGWAAQADAAAAASGMDPSSYARKMYVMPRNACPGTGFATLGGTPSQSWVFSCETGPSYAHEMGHNLGLHHASDPAREYGDPTDPMGTGSWAIRGLNAPHRDQLGWLPSGTTQAVSQSGTYDVAPLAIDPAAAAAPQVLTIRKPDTGEQYYLSYRLAQGYDNYISGWYYGKLSVHKYAGDASATRTYLLAGLADGETFADEVSGLSVTLESHGPASARVNIALADTCQVSDPTVHLTPDVRDGAAGSTLGYALSLTNNDTAWCTPRTFSLTAGVPSGWAGVLPAPAVNLAPGASATTTLAVTSAPTSVAGNYPVRLTVADSASLAPTPVAATYTVLADTTPPSRPTAITTLLRQKQKQIQVSWAASTDDVAVAGYMVLRDGAIVGLAPTTTWSDPEWRAGSTYVYAVLAYDEVGNNSPLSDTASVTLPGGGGGKKR